jgi:hypothetical protein
VSAGARAARVSKAHACNHQGINRGPAGLLAYLLLHTRVASLRDAYNIVKGVRSKARTRSNTFSTELETICREAGKPLA